MHTIVVSDIFGRTSELGKLCEALNTGVNIIDPYSGKFMCFNEESRAYDYFMSNVGIPAYSELLLEKLNSVSNPTRLIGFSVGASAVWKSSEEFKVGVIQRVICFYGSQIRNHIDIIPCVSTDLILPKSEPGFSVSGLAQLLSKKNSVEIQNTPFLYGFMNALSKNFNQVGYNKYINWLCVNAS